MARSLPVTPRSSVASHTLVGVLVAALALAPAASAQNPITRVNVAPDGSEADFGGGTNPPAVSADGRFIAFDSPAKNLVPGDVRYAADVFLHDRATGSLVCISRALDGLEGDGESATPALSSDGRFIAFASSSGNLVAGDTNGHSDCFVRDRDPDGDGLFDEADAFTLRVSVHSDGSEGDGPSYSPAIDGAGTQVAFASDATNLGNADSNAATDIFVHDLLAGTTRKASLAWNGAGGKATSFGPSFSADGRFVAFASRATNLVLGDTNGKTDLFLRDLVAATTERVSVGEFFAEADGDSFAPAALSADGAQVAFLCAATNLVDDDANGDPDLFVRDRSASITTLVSRASDGSLGSKGANSLPACSSDGRFITFTSDSIEFDPGDTNGRRDLFLHDRQTGVTELLSKSCKDVVGDDDSWSANLSADGTLVAFTSEASNLVGADTLLQRDVFRLDRTLPAADASWQEYGSGYAGSNGVPSFSASADPEYGAAFTLDVGNSANRFTPAFLLIGEEAASLPTRDGGTLLVELSLMIPLALWPSGLSVPVDIPDDVDLCGATFYVQVVAVDPGATHGLSFTAGLALVVGK